MNAPLLKLKYFSAVLFLFLTSLLLHTNPATAQSTGEPAEKGTSFWIFGGPNINTLGTGISAGASATTGNHIFSLRTVSTDTEPYNQTWEIAVLYGRTTAIRDFLFNAGTGVAVVGGERYPRLFATGDSEKLEPMIGFPLEAQIIWNPTKFAGLGLYGFANVNTGQPFGGLTLNVRIGTGW